MNLRVVNLVIVSGLFELWGTPPLSLNIIINILQTFKNIFMWVPSDPNYFMRREVTSRETRDILKICLVAG